MKRLIALVSTLAIVISACSSGGATPTAAPATSAPSVGGSTAPAASAAPATLAPTSINVIAAQYTDQMQPYFDSLSKAFTAKYPGVTATVTVVNWNDIDQKIKTMVSTQQYPDIGNLNYFASFAADGLLYKADEMVSPDVQADIIQTFRDNSKYQGVEYAVPDLASDRLFFYNTDIFTKAGITAAPQTWDDLTADCAKIKASDPSITPLALPLGPEEAQAEFLMWAGGNGGGVFKDGKWVINSPENVATLKFLKTLVDSKCTESSPGTFNRTAGAFALFSSGKAAMVNGSVFFPGVLTTNKSTVKYSQAPVPHATGKTSITLGVQDYWFAFKKPGNSNQPAVQAFMDFMYQPDNYAAFLKAAGGFLPATKSAGQVADPALKPFIDVLPSAIFYPSDQAAWPAVQTSIQQTIGTAVQGTDPQKVLDQIQAKATAAGQ